MKDFIKKIPTLTWIIIGAAAFILIMTLIFFVFAVAKPLETTTAAQGDTAAPATAEGAEIAEDQSAALLPTQTLPGSVLDYAQEGGEGCDWSTCAWMESDQCTQCGGSWKDYSDEAYCDCSASKWQSLELEWCKFEGGAWLQDEDRCTFKTQAVSLEGATNFSACTSLYYDMKAGDDTGYQAFQQSCKNAGGVEQCWNLDCSLSLCMCPDEENASGSCDWVSGEQVETDLKCYDENGTCWLTIRPTDAVNGLDVNGAKLEAIVNTSDGGVYTSEDLKRENGGCLYDKNQISCLIAEGGSFNTSLVEDAYLCMDMCCLNLENLEAGNIVVQSGDCPASGNLEVWDFQLTNGVLTFELRNNLGWDVNALDIFLDDAKGDPWTTMSCKIDDKYNTIMNCKGWAVYKSGYATISFYYGTGSSACTLNNFKYYLPEISRCNANEHYCAAAGKCCSSAYTCCSCGCKKLDDDETCSDACD